MTAYTETVDGQTTSASRAFDAANRLQTSLDATAGTTSYIYDDNGNLTTVYPPGSDGQNPVGVLRYDYDQRNLMVSHETNPDGTAWVLQVAYVYDGANDRLQQVNYTSGTPVTTTYSNDVVGLTQVLVANDGTNQVYNLFGLDLILQDSGSEVRTLLADGLGSVRVEMEGNVVETATTYSPYGEVLEQAGASGTAYGFTGEQDDSATGLLYLRARYYNPYLNHFHSRDPFSGFDKLPVSQNGYNYANGNPVNLTDPTGRDPWWCDNQSYSGVPSYAIQDQIDSCRANYYEALLSTRAPQTHNSSSPTLQYAYSEQYGWFDRSHISPGKAMEFIENVRAIANGTQSGDTFIYDKPLFREPLARLEVKYWVSGDVTSEQVDNVALAIYMDWERHWERWQGQILFGNSSFAIEDLPSDYIGFYAAATGTEWQDVLQDLGPLEWSDEGPPDPHLVMPMLLPLPWEFRFIENINTKFTPKIEVSPGTFANVPWPDCLQIEPLHDEGLWRFVEAKSKGWWAGWINAPWRPARYTE